MIKKMQLKELRHARQYEIGRLLLLGRRDFESRLSEKLELSGHKGPSRSSGALLPFIDLEGTRSTELARRIGISKQAAAKAVKELEEEGLLTRTEDEADGRAFLVSFTDRGVEYLLQIHNAIIEIEREYETLVGVAQMNTVRRTLSSIVYANQDDEV